MVSTATRDRGSLPSSASRIASLIASQILSGCPSVTDSDVNSLDDPVPLTAHPYPYSRTTGQHYVRGDGFGSPLSSATTASHTSDASRAFDPRAMGRSVPSIDSSQPALSSVP